MALRRLLPTLIALAALMAPAATARAPRRAAGCPGHDRRLLVSRTPGASAALVPGHPQAVLLCRYSGLHGAQTQWQRLVGRRVVRSRATARHLAAVLDALPPVNGVQACPADDGSAVAAFFRYRSGPPDPVTVGLTGCRLVTNGYAHREAGAVADELRRLVR